MTESKTEDVCFQAPLVRIQQYICLLINAYIGFLGKNLVTWTFYGEVKFKIKQSKNQSKNHLKNFHK